MCSIFWGEGSLLGCSSTDIFPIFHPHYGGFRGSKDRGCRSRHRLLSPFRQCDCYLHLYKWNWFVLVSSVSSVNQISKRVIARFPLHGDAERQSFLHETAHSTVCVCVMSSCERHCCWVFFFFFFLELSEPKAECHLVPSCLREGKSYDQTSATHTKTI